MLRKLGAYPRQNALAIALRELGKLERTLFPTRIGGNIRAPAVSGFPASDASSAGESARTWMGDPHSARDKDKLFILPQYLEDTFAIGRSQPGLQPPTILKSLAALKTRVESNYCLNCFRM
jgi:hypothetical protein